MAGMTLLWMFVAALVAVIAIVTLVDLARHRHLGWGTAGWVALIVFLPLAGSIAYWIVRPTSRGEVEEAYQLEAELHRTGARGPYDRVPSQRERDHF
jgi:Phospholipase_D-nuclease N-terminal